MHSHKDRARHREDEDDGSSLRLRLKLGRVADALQQLCKLVPVVLAGEIKGMIPSKSAQVTSLTSVEVQHWEKAGREVKGDI